MRSRKMLLNRVRIEVRGANHSGSERLYRLFKAGSPEWLRLGVDHGIIASPQTTHKAEWVLWGRQISGVGLPRYSTGGIVGRIRG